MGLLVPISWVYWRGVARGWSHEIMFIKDSAQCLERSRPSINNTYYLFALIYIFSTAFRPPFFLFPYTIPSFLLPCLSVHLCACVCVCVSRPYHSPYFLLLCPFILFLPLSLHLWSLFKYLLFFQSFFPPYPLPGSLPCSPTSPYIQAPIPHRFRNMKFQDLGI